MAAVAVVRDPRTWYGRPTHSVVITDPTGKIAFHGYTRRGASRLAPVLVALVGDRPVGALADILARVLALREPARGEEWTARL